MPRVACHRSLNAEGEARLAPAEEVAIDERENRAPATENPALSPDDTISAFGETHAKRAAVAAEHDRMQESGDLAAQAAHEARESLIADEERPRRRHLQRG